MKFCQIYNAKFTIWSAIVCLFIHIAASSGLTARPHAVGLIFVLFFEFLGLILAMAPRMLVFFNGTP